MEMRNVPIPVVYPELAKEVGWLEKAVGLERLRAWLHTKSGIGNSVAKGYEVVVKDLGVAVLVGHEGHQKLPLGDSG